MFIVCSTGGHLTRLHHTQTVKAPSWTPSKITEMQLNFTRKFDRGNLVIDKFIRSQAKPMSSTTIAG